MDRIINSHFNSFVHSFGLNDYTETKQFEFFANYCIASKYSFSKVEPENITSDEDDAGIDGIIFFLDNEIVSTIEEFQEVLDRPKRSIEARVIFTQVTTTSKFEKSKYCSFSAGVMDFCSEDPEIPEGSFLRTAKEMFDLLINNVGKIRNGKPSCDLYYVATSSYDNSKEFNGALKASKSQLLKTGIFQEVEAFPVDREILLKYWLECSQKVAAKLDTKGLAALPAIPNVREAYLGIVKAQDFVQNILQTDDGEMRGWVFNENVRGYLGSDAAVNSEIKNTLSSSESRKRFAILNNGVTVVSPDIRVQGTSIHLENFQIVNGCQTSSVLFENRDILTDDVHLPVKFIEADDSEVISEIVRATNRQTKVDEVQFLSMNPLLKRIEEYFKSYESEEFSIHFERRDRQFSGQGIPQIRVFNIREACRAMASMFCDRPDLAMRYPNHMFKELSDKMLDQKNKECMYFAACLGLYRIHLFISNSRLPQNYRRFKWHFLMGLKYAVLGNRLPQFSSREMEKSCDKLINEFKLNKMTSSFNKVKSFLKKHEDVSRNRLTSKQFLRDLVDEVSS